MNRRFWRMAAAVGCVWLGGFLAFFSGGCGPAAPDPSAPPSSSGGSDQVGQVRMQFDFGDGRVVESVLPSVQPGTTVETLMRRVTEVPIQLSGSGTTALVQSIDGYGMSGGQGWLYQVDGQWAERGIGQTTVKPGSEIRWRYGRFDTATAGDGAGS